MTDPERVPWTLYHLLNYVIDHSAEEDLILRKHDKTLADLIAQWRGVSKLDWALRADRTDIDQLFDVEAPGDPRTHHAAEQLWEVAEERWAALNADGVMEREDLWLRPDLADLATARRHALDTASRLTERTKEILVLWPEDAGDRTEVDLATLLRVDRQTIRAWLGKQPSSRAPRKG
jgi:hypothetical protein